MAVASQAVSDFITETFDIVAEVRAAYSPKLVDQELGRLTFVGQGIARVSGLPGAQLDELLQLPAAVSGMVFNLETDEVGVVLLNEPRSVRAGDLVHRTHRVLDISVSRGLLGRVIDATGAPLDNLPAPAAGTRLPVERPAPPIMHRAPVTVPLQTGIKVIDALIPIGRGQRELILGDRQTGKSAIALDAVINQRGRNVVCVYCTVGQRHAAVARLVADLRAHGALEHTCIVAAGGEDPPGLQFVAPYAATTIGEYFMEQGEDVLVVYDDLTHHARAYRELALLLRRPPGREAYPGDVFYIHSRLLERSTHLRPEHGGGSLTALPIIETHAQDMSAYIPTNLISITDGQIYLSPTLFHKGIIPAVDVGRSVSRVGGKAQLPAYHAVAGPLRLAFSQFEELEVFSRFSTRLDEQTRRTLERGRRLRELLKQAQYQPIPAPDQIAVLLAATAGVFDTVGFAQIGEAERAVRHRLTREPDVVHRIEDGAPLTPADRAQVLALAEEAVGTLDQSDRA
jgi:F-type H+-transporting ATPase subunit alpha